MVTVKVGDRVQSIPFNGAAVKHHIGCTGTVIRWPTHAKGPTIKWDDGVISKHSPSLLIPLVEPVDDPLPPAPGSVRYYSSTTEDRCLDVAPGNECVRLWSRKIHQNGVTFVSLDADSALDLAHDLTRMAMEIKRKQRAAEQKLDD